MYAQLIKSRLKPGAESELEQLQADLRTYLEQRSGVVRSMIMQSQKELAEYWTLIVFETEAQARETEMALESEGVIQRVRALYEGEPEYIDLNVVQSFPA